jgi:acyl-CoA dehydrogenase
MDFTLSPDVLMLRDMLRRFLENEVRPLESEYFTTGNLKPEVRARLRARIEQMGLWGPNVPFDLEGCELDQVTACVLEEELGKTFIPLEIGDIPPMLYACRGEQIQRFLKPILAGKRRVFLAAREPDTIRPEDWSTSAVPERMDTSDPSATSEPPRDNSEETDSAGSLISDSPHSFVINGTKLLAGLPQAEDFLVVFAKTSPGITAFMLDADQSGLEFMTGHGTAKATSQNHPLLDGKAPGVHLKDIHLQRDAILGEYGQALTLGAADAPRGWIRIGARYVGLAERLLEMSAEYARDWIALGRPLSGRPAVQRMLAEMQVQTECCRWMVYHAAWLADKQDPLRIPTAQVQLATSQLLEKAIDFVILIYGGPGPSVQTEKQRFLLSYLPHEAMSMMIESAAAVVASQILAKP